MTPRITPGSWRQTGPLVQGFARLAGRVARTEPPAVFLTLGRHQRLFWGWLLFAGALMPGGRLPRRDTELVILRVATVRGSAYELTQHRGLARRAGLTAAEVELAGPWTPRQELLLATTDALLEAGDLDEPQWAALREVLDEREAIELVLLVGHYAMLATTLTTLRVQPDRPR